jgi:hypothetical protein
MDNSNSLTVLNQLYEYDSFLDSITSVASMGNGASNDIVWWANLTTRDSRPEPHNYKCYAIDIDNSKLEQLPNLPNLSKLHRDFTKLCLPIKVDLIWAYNCLQYSSNPLETLKLWNEQLNVNGMMILCVPQHNGVEFNRYYNRTYSNCFYHYTPTNLIYMLAVNGFDCRDAYLLKKFNDPWIYIAVYKSEISPMDPSTTSWMDLISTKLLHPTVENSIITHGYLRQEDILYPWLDKENYFIDYVSQWTEVPEEAGDPIVTGVFNTSTNSTEPKLKQANHVTKETKISKPIGIMRPPKKKYE